MKDGKTGVGRLLQKIGHMFASLWMGAEKAYNGQPEAVKQSLLIATGVVHLINENLDAAPEVVIDKIHEMFPGIDQALLDSSLNKVATRYGVDIEDGLIAGLQAFFKSHSGIDWAEVSDGAAKIISIGFAPKGTKATALFSLIWWVYQKFFHVQKAA